MTKKKDPAAQALAAKRWAGKTKAEKKAVGAALAEAANAAMSDEAKKLRAQKAAAARWSGHKKAKKPRKKQG